MSTATHTTLNLKYTLKPDARESLLTELKAVLDLCAKEPEFVTAFLQETAERPNEILLFEIWRGTHDDFVRVQGVKPYRKDYLARSKQYVEKVDVAFSTPCIEWGTQLLSL